MGTTPYSFALNVTGSISDCAQPSSHGLLVPAQQPRNFVPVLQAYHDPPWAHVPVKTSRPKRSRAIDGTKNEYQRIGELVNESFNEEPGRSGKTRHSKPSECLRNARCISRCGPTATTSLPAANSIGGVGT
ncbi:hypothetical protein K491DRAFT_311003 [Lophiostoma macrostomum CBS 122681]|uniref:Uncharacterized protein n=1 Tax=Lophiostoma macrostomum CBS 122681 TaxID=1314788 RepID=A0A6A6SHP9_9PLEO|nr:hypothetical protein K491DRAFT_311003 [Lophiostoma macrostomum CBS 122681]